MLPPPKHSNDFNFYAAVFSYFSTITRFSLQLQVIHPPIFFHCLGLDPIVVIPGKGAGHIGRATYLRTYLYSSFSPKQRVPDYKWWHHRHQPVWLVSFQPSNFWNLARFPLLAQVSSKWPNSRCLCRHLNDTSVLECRDSQIAQNSERESSITVLKKFANRQKRGDGEYRRIQLCDCVTLVGKATYGSSINGP